MNVAREALPAAGPEAAGSLEWWQMPDADPDRPLTLEQAARWLQLATPDPVKTLRRWVRDGVIPSIHVGRQPFVTLSILRAYATREMPTTRRR